MPAPASNRMLGPLRRAGMAPAAGPTNGDVSHCVPRYRSVNDRPSFGSDAAVLGRGTYEALGAATGDHGGAISGRGAESPGSS